MAGAKGYESRPGQAKMAEKVAEVIEGKQHLVVEAGEAIFKEDLLDLVEMEAVEMVAQTEAQALLRLDLPGQ